MEVFKCSIAEVDSILKELKVSRQEQAKHIRESYKQLVEKSSESFERCQQRIESNMVRFVEGNLQQEVLTLNFTDCLGKAKEKMQLIDKQIDKVRVIIANGCGTIHQKKASDRQSNYDRSELQEIRSSSQAIRTRQASTSSTVISSISKLKTEFQAAVRIQRWWRRIRQSRRHNSHPKREYC